MKVPRVLVVDDLYTNRFLLREILKTAKFEFLIVENGKEAIEALEREHFDLILMDIEMPVMNGLETTIHIRKKLASPLNKIPIIALTAHNPKLFFEDFRDVGFDSIITKPYSVQKLLELVKLYT
jgi:CheY-like chemotaxis protein